MSSSLTSPSKRRQEGEARQVEGEGAGAGDRSVHRYRDDKRQV